MHPPVRTLFRSQVAISHQNFLNAYLVANGPEAVDMEPFRTLPGSTMTGSSGKLRLTNLTELKVDTSR